MLCYAMSAPMQMHFFREASRLQQQAAERSNDEYAKNGPAQTSKKAMRAMQEVSGTGGDDLPSKTSMSPLMSQLNTAACPAML